MVMRIVISIGLLWILSIAPTKVWAGEPDPLDVAIHKGVSVLQKGVNNYPTHRKCFSCHHQTLPLFAISLAEKDRKLKQPEIKSCIDDFTHESFAGKNESMSQGGGVGGGALTVGYGLWALDMANHAPNATSKAMVEYLIRNQEPNGSWEYESHRPPAASSVAMTTAIAVYGLKAYGPESLSSTELADSLMKAAHWFLTSCNPTNHEDVIGEAWGYYLLREQLQDIRYMNRFHFVRVDEHGEPVLPGFVTHNLARITQMSDDGIDLAESVTQEHWDRYVARARGQAIWKTQRADGGWGQEPSMSSDPYATSQALIMLAQVDYGDYRNPVHGKSRFQHGIQYLMQSQQEDGSWHVSTRAKPIQVFFDNGDPHGKDQFISMMATSWAVAALANNRIFGPEPLESNRVSQRLRRGFGME